MEHGSSTSPEVNGEKNRSPMRGPEGLHDEDRMFDLENASSSSPISQIEMEAGDTKLSGDGASALLAFTCPDVNAGANVAVLGALSIVSSL